MTEYTDGYVLCYNLLLLLLLTVSTNDQLNIYWPDMYMIMNHALSILLMIQKHPGMFPLPIFHCLVPV